MALIAMEWIFPTQPDSVYTFKSSISNDSLRLERRIPIKSTTRMRAHMCVLRFVVALSYIFRIVFFTCFDTEHLP